ncbi:VIT family protein [Sphingomonas ginkgonis]|uniref:VIT family protein n=1 Tax=Sphingomonas ginkgonis TaxID=2315330 RepID=A0A3R9WNB5_9SPHN|nr:VIT1/CCC1 transporter family protein [Sphingomonas ginkgonis]RST30463.1 VIT family protein [Sphingomonas ginkgonis]
MTEQSAVNAHHHAEEHFVTRTGWLRAAVLGANDGLLSTASLMVGVAAAAADAQHVILTGVAGIAAGAMSMAAGEYVSVSSQADAERADLARERHALHHFPEQEKAELAGIYRERGLHPDLAEQVADALHENDALAAHARDELGLTDTNSANPVQAAVASAASFVAGGLPPLLAAVVAGGQQVLAVIAAVTLVMLALLGAAGARLGGAPLAKATLRVLLFGTLAMLVTAAVGRAFHTVV